MTKDQRSVDLLLDKFFRYSENSYRLPKKDVELQSERKKKLGSIFRTVYKNTLRENKARVKDPYSKKTSLF